MPRSFPLAGLLRLKQLHQDAAAVDLAQANSRSAAHNARQNAAQLDLQDTPSEVSNAAALSAVAAARSSSRSMLSELAAVTVQNQAAAEAAQAAYNTARTESVRLEKLATKHRERTAVEELHAEQTILDELAVNSWHRSREVAKP